MVGSDAERSVDLELREVSDRLMQTSVFTGVDRQCLESLGTVRLLSLNKDESSLQRGNLRGFYVLLSGAVKVQKLPGVAPVRFEAGDAFGEIPILANKRIDYTLTAIDRADLIEFSEEMFWKLMFNCPSVRERVLGNMARRLETYQAQEVQRERLTSLGTLAAGLMHELKNPSTAAIRAASQMRENMSRLQQLSMKLSSARPNQQQMDCLNRLQHLALGAVCCRAMDSLEQSSAEEKMEEQLEKAGVRNGWRLAPTLVAMGLTSRELDCASDVFTGEELSDSLNWLEALMSSVQLVGTIEESLGRVHELVMAVKHYSYENDANERTIDVHTSLQSTLLILGHKLRQKQITVEKDFAVNLPAVHLRAGGLNQVWTNLLDNAIDASPERGIIRIVTTSEGDLIRVAIEDHGQGISREDTGRVFEPFYTTKPAGLGSGLGLDIVHRILSMKLGGKVSFESRPGCTVFTVELPTDWKQ